MTFVACVDSECSVKVNPGLLTLGQPKHRSFSAKSGFVVSCWADLSQEASCVLGSPTCLLGYDVGNGHKKKIIQTGKNRRLLT